VNDGNPNLGRPSGYDNVSVAGRKGLRATLSNTSEVTGQPEAIQLYTTLMRDGSAKCEQHGRDRSQGPCPRHRAFKPSNAAVHSAPMKRDIR